MDYKSFREAFLKNEFELTCSFCGAVFWVEDDLLKRVGEMPHERCPICSEIHEMMS